MTRNLDGGAAYLEAYLRLLDDPYELYVNAPDDLRRSLNQVIFARIYVMNDEVVGDELQSPVAELLDAKRDFVRRQAAGYIDDRDEKATRLADGLRSLSLLSGMNAATDCSKPFMVGLRGFESPTVWTPIARGPPWTPRKVPHRARGVLRGVSGVLPCPGLPPRLAPLVNHPHTT